MNNMLVLDHHGLFIYLNSGYHDSFHDVNILCELNLYKNWCYFFVHINKYFEYLLGDPSYMGKEMFVMRKIKRCKLTLGHDLAVMNAYNKMHANYKVKVEWRIGGLK